MRQIDESELLRTLVYNKGEGRYRGYQLNGYILMLILKYIALFGVLMVSVNDCKIIGQISIRSHNGKGMMSSSLHCSIWL